MRTALHVSPHPDDESIAVPCTLLALRDAGWRVINLAVSLGRPEQVERRRDELAHALAIAGIEGRTMDEPARISAGDKLGEAQRAITAWIDRVLAETQAELVVGPHPQDGHHGHEVVGRAIQESIRAAAIERAHGGGQPPVWWMWSIWRELTEPTLVVGCSDHHLEIAEKMIEAHSGENARNDYHAMHRPLRRVNAVKGAERVFGFGAKGLDVTSAELLTEVTWIDPGWYRGEARLVIEPEIRSSFGIRFRPDDVLWTGVPKPKRNPPGWESGVSMRRPASSVRRLLGGERSSRS